MTVTTEVEGAIAGAVASAIDELKPEIAAAIAEGIRTRETAPVADLGGIALKTGLVEAVYADQHADMLMDGDQITTPCTLLGGANIGDRALVQFAPSGAFVMGTFGVPGGPGGGPPTGALLGSVPNTVTAETSLVAFVSVPSWQVQAANGTAGSPTSTVAAQELGAYRFGGYGATGPLNGLVALRAFAAENHTDTAGGAYASLYVTPTTTIVPVEAQRWNADGSSTFFGPVTLNGTFPVDAYGAVGNGTTNDLAALQAAEAAAGAAGGGTVWLSPNKQYAISATWLLSHPHVTVASAGSNGGTLKPIVGGSGFFTDALYNYATPTTALNTLISDTVTSVTFAWSALLNVAFPLAGTGLAQITHGPSVYKYSYTVTTNSGSGSIVLTVAYVSGGTGATLAVGDLVALANLSPAIAMIRVQANDVKLQGFGFSGGTSTVASNPMADCIVIEGVSSAPSNIRIEDITGFYHNGWLVNAIPIGGLYANGPPHAVFIVNCYSRQAGRGIHLQGGGGSRSMQCQLTNTWIDSTSFGPGLHLEDVHDCDVSNSQFSTALNTNTAPVLVIHGDVRTLQMTTTQFGANLQAGSLGLLIEAGVNGQPYNNFPQNIEFAACTFGAADNGGLMSSGNAISFTGCLFSLNNISGFVVTGGGDVTFLGCSWNDNNTSSAAAAFCIDVTTASTTVYETLCKFNGLNNGGDGVTAATRQLANNHVWQKSCLNNLTAPLFDTITGVKPRHYESPAGTGNYPNGYLFDPADLPPDLFTGAIVANATLARGVSGCNATGGALTMTLPSAGGIGGQLFTVIKTDASVNTVTINTTSAQTIDGASTLVLSSQYELTTVMSNGSNWFVVGGSGAVIGGVTGALIGSTVNTVTAATSIVAYGAATANGSWRIASAAGTVGSPTALLSGSQLGKVSFGGYTSGGITYGLAAVRAVATENFSATAGGTKLTFEVTANTTLAQSVALTLDQDQTATFGGPVILHADPTVPLGAATKQYVDAAVGGGTGLSGSIANVVTAPTYLDDNGIAEWGLRRKSGGTTDSQELGRYGFGSYYDATHPLNDLAYFSGRARETHSVSAGGTEGSVWTTPLGSVTAIETARFTKNQAIITGNQGNKEHGDLTGYCRYITLSTTNASAAIVADVTTPFVFEDEGRLVSGLNNSVAIFPDETRILSVTDATHATLNKNANSTSTSQLALIGAFGSPLFILAHDPDFSVFKSRTTGQMIGHRTYIAAGTGHTDKMFPSVAQMVKVSHLFEDDPNSQMDAAGPGPRGLYNAEGNIWFGAGVPHKDAVGGPFFNSGLIYQNKYDEAAAPGGIIYGMSLSPLIASTGTSTGTLFLSSLTGYWSNAALSSFAGTTLDIGEWVPFQLADGMSQAGTTHLHRYHGFRFSPPASFGGTGLPGSGGAIDQAVLVDIGAPAWRTLSGLSTTSGSVDVTSATNQFVQSDEGAIFHITSASTTVSTGVAMSTLVGTQSVFIAGLGPVSATGGEVFIQHDNGGGTWVSARVTYTGTSTSGGNHLVNCTWETDSASFTASIGDKVCVVPGGASVYIQNFVSATHVQLNIAYPTTLATFPGEVLMPIRRTDNLSGAIASVGYRNAMSTVLTPPLQTIIAGSIINSTSSLIELLVAANCALGNPNISTTGAQNGQVLKIYNVGPGSVTFTNTQGVALPAGTTTLAQAAGTFSEWVFLGLAPGFNKWSLVGTGAGATGSGGFNTNANNSVMTAPPASGLLSLINVATTETLSSSGGLGTFLTYHPTATFAMNGSVGFSTAALLNYAPILKNAAANHPTFLASYTLLDTPTFRADTDTGVIGSSHYAISTTPKVDSINGGAWATPWDIYGIRSGLTLNATAGVGHRYALGYVAESTATTVTTTSTGTDTPTTVGDPNSTGFIQIFSANAGEFNAPLGVGCFVFDDAGIIPTGLVAAASNGVAVSSLTGTQSVFVNSLTGFSGGGGTAAIQHSTGAVCVITYTGTSTTAGNHLVNCTRVSTDIASFNLSTNDKVGYVTITSVSGGGSVATTSQSSATYTRSFTATVYSGSVIVTGAASAFSAADVGASISDTEGYIPAGTTILAAPFTVSASNDTAHMTQQAVGLAFAGHSLTVTVAQIASSPNLRIVAPTVTSPSGTVANQYGTYTEHLTAGTAINVGHYIDDGSTTLPGTNAFWAIFTKAPVTTGALTADATTTGALKATDSTLAGQFTTSSFGTALQVVGTAITPHVDSLRSGASFAALPAGASFGQSTWGSTDGVANRTGVQLLTVNDSNAVWANSPATYPSRLELYTASQATSSLVRNLVLDSLGALHIGNVGITTNRISSANFVVDGNGKVWFSPTAYTAGAPTAAPLTVAATGDITCTTTLTVGSTGQMTVGAAGAIATSAGIKSSSPTGGIGYSTGAGGAVTQLTNKGTAFPTISKVCGTLTWNNAALAASTSVTSASSTNTAIAATDTVVFMHISGGTLGAYTMTCTPGAGSWTLTLHNVSTGSLSEAPVFAFAILKAVTA